MESIKKKMLEFDYHSIEIHLKPIKQLEFDWIELLQTQNILRRIISILVPIINNNHLINFRSFKWKWRAYNKGEKNWNEKSFNWKSHF